jgi:GNAT superfamily N-acetyltransferase
MLKDGHAMEPRQATPADAASLSWVHAETWKATFVGQVPDVLAEERILKARERDWVTYTEQRVAAGGGVLVVAEEEEVVGFCEYGPTEDADDDPSRVGHIMRVYVRPQSQAKGAGRMLVEAACERLALDGYDQATLWTLDGPTNRALGFYAHLGWSCEDVRNGEEPPDVRYRRRLQ